VSADDGIRIALDWPRGDFLLSLQVELPGCGVTAIHGPSGSGKTTLLRCIAGLDHAPGARISVHGQVWQDAQRFLPCHRRNIGFVFQDASLFSHLDVRGNLHYGLRRKAGADPALLDAAIHTLAIGALLDRRPDQLSGGERQRVAIARALALAPQLLLMDEPLSALDAARKQELLPYLERLHDALAIPLLYVSHAADEVARLADHLLLLDAGRVRAAGPITELLGRLDPPVALGDQLGVVLATRAAERDPAFHLVRLQFDGGSLWARDPGQALGQRLRVRVLARDVSISRERPGASSILNLLPARIDAISAADDPAFALLRLNIGASVLLAQLTARSVAALDLQPGQSVWAQVKSVALLA